MKTPEEKLESATKAIKHALNTICDDPQKFYLLGTGTQTYALLTQAHADINDCAVEEIRESFVPDPGRHEQYLNERKETARLVEIGREHDTKEPA